LETVDIHPLTRRAVKRFLGERATLGHAGHDNCQRQATRWPFPGTVELWIPVAASGERYALASSVNLSVEGMAIKHDEALVPGTEVGIAFHEPEASFHGRASVRHCTEIADGVYFVGMQFRFSKD